MAMAGTGEAPSDSGLWRGMSEEGDRGAEVREQDPQTYLCLPLSRGVPFTLCLSPAELGSLSSRTGFPGRGRNRCH